MATTAPPGTVSGHGRAHHPRRHQDGHGVDPQLGEYPAASILAAVARKDPNETDDKTLILADVATKAQVQVREFAGDLLRRHMDDARATEVATALSEGRWTHDFPIDPELARSFGLKVETCPTRYAG